MKTPPPKKKKKNGNCYLVADFVQTIFFLQNFRRLFIFLLFSKFWKEKMFDKKQKNVSTSEKEQKNVI